MTSARVDLLTDASADAHASPGHPERPERRAAAAAGVAEGARTAGAELVSPLVEPIGVSLLEIVHPAEYVAALDRAEATGGAWLDPDTYLVPGSMSAARGAAGATVAAASAVTTGEASVAFAVVRPPGHHARAARGSGFCLLNNVAIAAAALRAGGLAERVAIVDWDVHHGDGTQAIFDAEPAVTYASTHQWPFYPGTGAAGERGSGAAAGTMLNAPLPAGAGDAEFVEAWRDRLLPAIEAAEPQAILVSAGYDAHRADPLAALEVTEDGYRQVAELLGGVAARLGLGGVALTLEGGYDLDALRASAAATVIGLLAGLRTGANRQ